MPDLDFTVSDLRSFFQENLDKSVGTTGLSLSCPIASYFEQKRGMKVNVTSLNITDNITEISALWNSRSLEPWQQCFVEDLDEQFSGLAPITGRGALRVLYDAIESVEGEGKDG